MCLPLHNAGNKVSCKQVRPVNHFCDVTIPLKFTANQSDRIDVNPSAVRQRMTQDDDDVPVRPRRSSPPRSLGLNTLGTATKEAVVCRRSRRPWLADEKGGRRLDSLTMCVHLGL